MTMWAEASDADMHTLLRTGTMRGTRLQDLKVFVMLTLVFFCGCFAGTEDLTDPTGGTPEPVDHEARVVVRNAGDGAGSVVVTFSAGTVTNGCQAVLGPGETCTVEVTHTGAISSASVVAEPGDYSIFLRFGGDCGGTSTECTVPISEPTVIIDVEVVFDLGVARIDFQPDPMTLGPGAEGSLVATAFADSAGERPVPGAAFTWESSDAGVATVRGQAGGSAIVTGIASGEAWIGATARNGRDSVKVVVGG